MSDRDGDDPASKVGSEPSKAPRGLNLLLYSSGWVVGGILFYFYLVVAFSGLFENGLGGPERTVSGLMAGAQAAFLLLAFRAFHRGGLRSDAVGATLWIRTSLLAFVGTGSCVLIEGFRSL